MSEEGVTLDSLFQDYTENEEGLNQNECYRLLAQFMKCPTVIDIKNFWIDKGMDKDAIIGIDELKELSDKLGDGAVRLSEALDVFDTNNDGFIDMEELKNLISENASIMGLDSSPDEDWLNHLWETADKNKDGKIEKKELAAMLQEGCLTVADHDFNLVDEQEQETV